MRLKNKLAKSPYQARRIKFLLCLSIFISIPLLSLGQTRKMDSVKALRFNEINLVIDRIENDFVLGKGKLSDEEWARRVKIIHDKVENSGPYGAPYLYAMRYIGLLVEDGHFDFPDQGYYNRLWIFTKKDVIFPVWIKTWKDGTVYCVKDYTSVIPVNSRILTVNGKSAQELALFNRSLMSAEELMSMSLMNYVYESNPVLWANFANFLHMESIKAPYIVSFISPGGGDVETVTLQGMTRKDRVKAYKKSGDRRRERKNSWSDLFGLKPIEYENMGNKIGVLTVNSFSGKSLWESIVSGKEKQFPRQLKRAMRKVKRDNIEHLIIDVSNNYGGYSNNILTLLSYFTNDSIDDSDTFRLSETYRKSINKRVSTIAKEAGMGQSAIDSILTVVDRVKDGDFFATDSVINSSKKLDKPKHSYTGKAYLLTGNNSYSASIEFSRYFKKMNIGLVAGQCCGGYTSVTHSPTKLTRLPMTRNIPLKIPCSKSSGESIFEYEGVNIEIDHPFEEWLNNENRSKEKLIDMIKSGALKD